MPEENSLTPGSLSQEDTSRILASIGEADKPRNEAGQFVSTKAPEEVEPTQDQPATADTAPDESQPSGENEAQVDTEAPPAVEPPASWTEERKAKFRELPPDVQDEIARRERERDVEVRRGQDEVAKAKADATKEREEYHGKLNQLVPALTAQLNSRWANVDWTRLANEQPADYVKYRAQFEAELGQAQAAAQEKARLDEQAKAESDNKFKTFVKEQEAQLPKLIPSWKDEKVAKAELNDVYGYLIKEGIPEETIYGNRERGIAPLVNAKQIQIARKAMLYDRAQSRVAKPNPQSQPAPRVQKPGSSDPTRPETQAKKQQWDALVNRGHITDAAAILKTML